MNSLKELQAMVVAFRDERDWKQFHNPKDCAISLSLEAAEFLELFQWKSSDEVQEFLSAKKIEVSDELADVLYWILLISNDLDIDLADAFVKKLEKNSAKYPVDKARGTHKKYSEL